VVLKVLVHQEPQLTQVLQDGQGDQEFHLVLEVLEFQYVLEILVIRVLLFHLNPRLYLEILFLQEHQYLPVDQEDLGVRVPALQDQVGQADQANQEGQDFQLLPVPLVLQDLLVYQVFLVILQPRGDQAIHLHLSLRVCPQDLQVLAIHQDPVLLLDLLVPYLLGFQVFLVLLVSQVIQDSQEILVHHFLLGDLATQLPQWYQVHLAIRELREAPAGLEVLVLLVLQEVRMD
jgi:hypothetical protein